MARDRARPIASPGLRDLKSLGPCEDAPPTAARDPRAERAPTTRPLPTEVFCGFWKFLNGFCGLGELLEGSGLPMIESQLIALELPDTNQPLLNVCTALLQAEINITQTYPLFSRPHGRPVVALMVDNIDHAVETLTDKGFNLITEDDLIFDQ